MKTEILEKKTVDIKTLEIKAKVRYWEDAVVNGEPDTDGDRIPCRNGNMWCPVIEVDTGRIKNWIPGVTADIHFKVCDAGSYYLLDDSGKIVLQIEQDYVPNKLVPGEYGDYIIMQVAENGMITDWPTHPSFENFPQPEL